MHSALPVVLQLVLLLLTGNAMAARAAERPNILFMLADDWGWGDVGVCENPITPPTPTPLLPSSPRACHFVSEACFFWWATLTCCVATTA